jgi:hypothetical protein
MSFDSQWLNEEELLFHRMESFHHQRVEVIAKGESPLRHQTSGVLVAHFVPIASVRSRVRYEGAELKTAAAGISTFGSRGGLSRFNIDGVLNLDSYDHCEAYTQVFRNGRVEAAMADVSYELRPSHQITPEGQHLPGPRGLRDSICESAIFTAVSECQHFFKSMQIPSPFFLFAALVGCAGVRIMTNRSFRDLSQTAIDRSPLFLPEVEFNSIDIEPTIALRQWCDVLWQSCGLERSFNFDQDGKWRERN